MKRRKLIENDKVMMSLVHFFVTVENYTPIVVKGVKDEVWLENLESKHKVIRISNNYIHNQEQFDEDILKIMNVGRQIKKKTFSLKLELLNIGLNIDSRVKNLDNKTVHTISIQNQDEISNNKYLNKYYPDVKDSLLQGINDLDMFVTATEDINETTYKRNKLYEDIFKKKKIIIANIIIAICIIMYVIMELDSSSLLIATLVKYGASNILLVQNNEAYRLITCMFLHAGIFHLLINMYSLNAIGKQLENFIGPYKFLSIYLISGMIGSMFSVILNTSSTVSVGASGAIFGLVGALLYFGYHYRLYFTDRLVKDLVPIVIINLIIGFSFSGIDNAAHIGGLVGGYLSAVTFGVSGKTDKSERTSGLVALILLITMLIYLIYFN